MSIYEELKEFNKARNWDQFHTPKNLAIALSVEAAELLEIFQWMSQSESMNLDTLTKSKVKNEVADIFIYLLNISNKLDINIIEATKEKIQINKRKYPISKAYGSNKKYTEL